MSEENTQEGFLDFPVEDAVEPQVVADGEYLIEAISASKGTSQKPGVGSYIKVLCRIVTDDYENPNLVNALCMLPDTEQDKQENNKRLLNLKRLYEAFEVPRDENGTVSLADFAGLEARVVLKTKTHPEYGDQNEIAKFL